MPATSRNVAELVSFVQSLSPGGSTNFIAAFEKAFDILENGAKSCKTSILFLTDGEADDPSHVISSRNTADIGAVIFSYTLGSGAKADVPKRLSEATDGIYTHIADGDTSLATVMSSYYLYYAYGAASTNNDMVVTSPYLDFATRVPMITMALPVYIDDIYFIGVVGIDLPLTFLSDALGDVVIGRRSYSFLVNEESEAILHPLIPNPLTTLFSEDAEYNAVFIEDLEPSEFDVTLLKARGNGNVKVTATVKQPAGDVSYNGYIEETADLLYFYAGVGPAALSVGFAIFTELAVQAPLVKKFGLASSPAGDCDVSDSTPMACKAPFVVFHNLVRMLECSYLSWVSQVQIGYGAAFDAQISTVYPGWYLQPNGYESPKEAVQSTPTCSELGALHQLTNGIGTVSASELPFGGFRDEVSAKILNSIKTMPALATQFWKDAWLAEDSTFMSLYFGSYQGLFVMYPAKSYYPTYNPLIRPWYQRAISYPDDFVLTTPYSDATTGKLVASGATTVNAQGSDDAFGVASFDYEFGVFLDFWESTMSGECDSPDKCFLVDSSAFLLYYDGIADDMGDDDIEHKFLGTFEPTLMQSLIEAEFFAVATNVNHLSNTEDVSYVVDAGNIVSTPTSFARNSGLYTVHAVTGTNLFVCHIALYSNNQYPSNCPGNSDCNLVQTPGCIIEGESCKSALPDVCDEADSPDALDDNACFSPFDIDDDGIWVLKYCEQSDMCATSFKDRNDCDDTHDIDSAANVKIKAVQVFLFVAISVMMSVSV